MNGIRKKLSKSKTLTIFNVKQINDRNKLNKRIEKINEKPSIKDNNIYKNENIRFYNRTMRNFNPNKEKSIFNINKTLENNSYYSTYNNIYKSDINEIYKDIRKRYKKI